MMERTHDQEWLESHAMFSCRNDGCREEVSYHAEDLRMHPDEGIICDSCYDFESTEDMPMWSDLKSFNPFPPPPKETP